ncbi:PTS sugar transporter subunit IIA, partial [Klebsiella pneumoniae]|nr:PTS sugar transporter subunit IIA [Klebsiella pneumoniae]MCS7344263.1 PTS sugar transporter subunit IIA [Klebsiella pneumoniae]
RDLILQLSKSSIYSTKPLVDQNATHIRLLAQVSGSLANEDIIAKLLVESDPHKIIALFNSETENADA